MSERKQEHLSLQEMLLFFLHGIGIDFLPILWYDNRVYKKKRITVRAGGYL